MSMKRDDEIVYEYSNEVRVATIIYSMNYRNKLVHEMWKYKNDDNEIVDESYESLKMISIIDELRQWNIKYDIVLW